MKNLSPSQKKDKFLFSLKKRTALYERLASFLDSGISIVDALTRIQMRYGKKKDFRARILGDWIKSMEGGARAADAMQPWIPSSEHMLIDAGDQGEGLVGGLREATVMSKASKAIRNAIIAGLAMPVALLLMLAGMLMMFERKMVPIFKNLLPVSHWSSAAQLLDSIASFISNYWWFAGLILIGLGFLIGMTIGTWTGKSRKFFDHIPPWSIYRTAQASSFLIGLSSLLRSGVAFFDSLKKIRLNANPYIRSHIDKMMNSVRQGGGSRSLGRSLNTGLFDPETAGDIEDYSELKQFESAMYEMGARATTESVEKINIKMAIARNLMMILVAGCIVWIYVTIYMLQSTIASAINAGSM